MARTKASVGAKVSSGKSSKVRCSAAPTNTSSGSGGTERSRPSGSGGGNPVCPRETPKWQRSINTFFITKELKQNGDSASAGRSNSKHKRNIIESDEEDAQDVPKNTELDETIDLEPLTGEDSHKIEEYYPTNKGKGVGKKTKSVNKDNVNTKSVNQENVNTESVNKENVNGNVERSKRSMDESLEENPSKKVKV